MKKISVKGFTLIELLVVISIIAVLVTIVLVAVRPVQNTQDARNVKRRADILTVLNAVNQYYVDNASFPAGTPAVAGAAKDIKSAAGGTLAAFCTALVPTYVAALPVDPSPTTGGTFTDCASYDTKYTIEQPADGRITISATGEGSAGTLSVSR